MVASEFGGALRGAGPPRGRAGAPLRLPQVSGRHGPPGRCTAAVQNSLLPASVRHGRVSQRDGTHKPSKAPDSPPLRGLVTFTRSGRTTALLYRFDFDAVPSRFRAAAASPVNNAPTGPPA